MGILGIISPDIIGKCYRIHYDAFRDLGGLYQGEGVIVSSAADRGFLRRVARHHKIIHLVFHNGGIPKRYGVFYVDLRGGQRHRKKTAGGPVGRQP